MVANRAEARHWWTRHIGGRLGGWSGIAFVLGLLIVGGMVSLPTAAATGEHISAFYAAHRLLISVQQVLSILILVPFLVFAAALAQRDAERRGQGAKRVIRAALLLVVAELATNLPAFVLAALSPATPATAHRLTVVEDLADAALFVSIAVLALVTGQIGGRWLRGAGLVVAALALARAVGSPLGFTGLDVVAPIAFLAFVLVLSLRFLGAWPRRTGRTRLAG